MQAKVLKTFFIWQNPLFKQIHIAYVYNQLADYSTLQEVDYVYTILGSGNFRSLHIDYG